MGRTKRCRSRKTPRPKSSDQEATVELLKWLKLKHLEMKIVDFPNSGRGVISQRVILPGEEILALPLEAMVTMNTVRGSRVSEIFESSSFGPAMSMSLWLLLEDHLGENSRYRPYLNILPRDFDCLFLCNKREMDLLPNWMQNTIDGRLKEIRESFELAKSSLLVENCSHCDLKFAEFLCYEKFLWAWTCVNTRCVYYEDETLSEAGEKSTSSSIALAPYLDFYNHSNRANVEAKLDCQRGVYILRTNDSYKKHQEIFIKYGVYSNLRLLVEYGFIEPDEDQDVVEFQFEDVLKAAKSVDPFYSDVSKLKYKFISYNNLNVNLSKSKDEFSWNCRGLLYILVTRDDNLANLLSKTYSSQYSDKENQIMEKIQQKLVELKERELQAQLILMEKLPQPYSRSFMLAKELVKMYTRILTS